MTKEEIKTKIEEVLKMRQQAVNDFELSKGNIRYFDGVLDVLRMNEAELSSEGPKEVKEP